MAGQQNDKREKFEKEVAAHPFLLGMKRAARPIAGRLRDAFPFPQRRNLLSRRRSRQSLYLIVRGKVRLESSTLGEPVTIDEIHDGDLLGWSWLFPPYAWHLTARALEETEAIFFYGTILREYCEKDHSLGFELFKRMSAVMLRRLQAARQKLMTARLAEFGKRGR